MVLVKLFLFNGTASTEIYTLSLHDALPICARRARGLSPRGMTRARDDGGGRPARRKSAVCTARSKPGASSTSWRRCWTVIMSRPEPRPAPVADEGLKLDRLQRDLLLSLIEDFIAAAPQAEGGAHYRALEEAVARMEVPPDLARSVGSIAEVALSTGRARNAFGP